MALNDSGDSVFIGDNAGQSDDATSNRNVAIGISAFQNNVAGARNTAVGYYSLNANTTNDNTGLGYFALSNVTTGTSNTAVGSASQVSSSVGNFNTSVGTNTLFFNASGSNNTAVGSSALRGNTTGSNNSGFGTSALFNNTSGSSNTAIGTAALFNNLTGSENTALGRNAGRYFSTGTSANTNASASIFIGFNSRANAVGETNQIVIGNEALGLGSNTVVLGNDNVTTTALKGNVGIGTTSPGYKLDVGGDIHVQTSSTVGTVYFGNSAQNYLSYSNSDSYYRANGAHYFEGSGFYKGIWNVDGNLGVGTTSVSGNSTNRVVSIVGADSANLVLTETGGASAAFTSYANEAYIGTATNHPFYLYTNGSERLRIGTNGAIKFNAYGSGTFTGTATQKLAVDSSGNVIEIPIGAGPVDGSGTANYITRWSDTDTITTSSIYETGGNIGIGTTSPGSLLQVGSGESTTDALIRLGVLYAGDRTSRGGISWRDSSDTTGKIYTEFDGTMTSMVFGSLYNSGYTTNQTMIIRGNGNVGIGTVTPAYKLSVVGKIALNDGGNSVFIGDNAGQSDDATANINVGIGTNALQNNITGNQNVAIGNNSLPASNSNNNTAVGSNTMQFNTSGFSCTGIGSYVLNSNSVGTFNTAVGTAAMITNTSGSSNTAIGSSAQRLAVSGSNNVSMGSTSLYNNVNGNDNVAIGSTAGRYFGTGTDALTDTSGSIYIGRWARANASGEVNQVVIGMNALGLGSNSVVLGNDNVTTTALKGNVGIGTNVPMGPLEIYKANPAGLGGHLILNNDGSSVGNETAILFNDSGGGSVSSIRAAISSTTENSPYLGDIKFKTGNTTYGSLSTRMIITGAGNVGIGTTTPSALLSGTERVLEISNSNLASLYLDSTTGRRWSVSSIATGQLTFWDIDAVAERMRIDTSGNVGIGTTSPDVKLEVVQASPTDGIIADFVNSTNAGGTTAAIKLSNADSEACDVVLGANRVGANFGSDFFISLSDSVDGSNQERFRITEAGNVGIGTTTPAYLLDVNGTARVTTLIETSAAKYKTNIQPLEPQLSKVTQLEPVTFDWLDKPQTKTNIGLIADEVEKIYPEFVSKTEDGEIEGIEYSKLTTVLIQSIKELKEIVDQQQAQINKLLSK
jgi:hypothetical protein